MQTPNAHILLVEDDLSHCTILQALINGWGYRVSVAHNGRQALEQVRAQPFDSDPQRRADGGNGRHRSAEGHQKL